MKLLILNGPNMNLLGLREPWIYGTDSYDALCRRIREVCAEEGADCEIFQSNHEGALVDKIQEAYGTADGIVINPAAYTHTSVAILDALTAVRLPAVEVHLSDTHAREEFRRFSYIERACLRTYRGLGFEGYAEAIRFLCEHIRKRQT